MSHNLLGTLENGAGQKNVYQTFIGSIPRNPDKTSKHPPLSPAPALAPGIPHTAPCIPIRQRATSLWLAALYLRKDRDSFSASLRKRFAVTNPRVLIPRFPTKRSCKSLTYSFLSAERQGFEPWVPVRVQRFSRPSRSTTPASFLSVVQR